MSILTIETGAGIAGANSYASIADADDFHTLRANAAWASATVAAKTAALVQATDYLEAYYKPLGYRFTLTQALQWPVAGTSSQITYSLGGSAEFWPGSLSEWQASSVPIFPPSVKSATIVLALYALSGPLTAPQTRGIKSEDKTLGGVGEVATVYDEPVKDPYPHVSAMLSDAAVCVGLGSAFVGKLIR